MRITIARSVGVVTLAIVLSGQAPIYNHHTVPVLIDSTGRAMVGCIGSPSTDQIAFSKRLADYKRDDPHMLIDLIIEKGAPDAAVVKFRAAIRQSV